ncbi:BTAD domain-containing putative transcriptional regulator [Salinispora sp. H7-4]|uniref:BTAD domain-containing putative transcriptional regulator n=1 Tax=Salinispora sp. H7-4 TaxID=2748321 RepID=UPI0015D106F5|nr:BTAD domain-containing putative transcriptional regulator [Salinispora sp. H7-4]NYT96176.1 LysM peptidoglycan-binding domain-containing protein [Salinispora sp. H7-4]
MAKHASTAVVRTATAALALAPPALLYQCGWLTAVDLSMDQVQAWVHQPLTTGFLALLVYVGAWLLWILLITAVTEHIHRYLATRLRWHLTLHLPGPLQALAATLLGTTAVTTAALPATAHSPTASDTGLPAVTPPSADATIRDAAPYAPPSCSAPSGLGHTVSLSTTTDAVPTLETRNSESAVATPPTSARNHIDAQFVDQHPDRSIDVTAGDTLWDLAANHLGDPHRWQEIYKLNQGHEQANGYALTDPNEIHIGWILALPARQAPPAATPQNAESPPPGSPGTTAPEANKTIQADPLPASPAPSVPESSPSPPNLEPSAPAGLADVDTPTPGAVTFDNRPDDKAGIMLPTRGWISLGLAAAIASVATLLRLQRRRHARLTLPAAVSSPPQRFPMPPSLAPVDIIDSRHLSPSNSDRHRASPAVAAPIGIDADGTEIGLFHLPGPGIALHGDGAIPTARAILASVLTTTAAETSTARPIVVTTADLIARLLPENALTVGLDPDNIAYDGERLIVLADTAAAITHAEEEMIGRRRLLDTFNAETILDLNTYTDHAETQPPYVLLIDSNPRHAPRLHAIATHHTTLDLHPVILGHHDGIPTLDISAEGTITSDEPHPATRLSTLSAGDLAAVLAMLTDAAARPEPGHDIDLDPAPKHAVDQAATTEAAPLIPAQPSKAAAPVRLRVLGPLLVETETGPVATGMRSGSYTVLASLAVHPIGRTLDQLSADLHPDTDPSTAGKRIRTDISTIRRVLRAATGTEAMFVVYDPAASRYHLDPELIAVDLWQMLTTIERANRAKDDTAALAALREAVEWYRGDFADGGDGQPWIGDHATTYRYQILSALARIAEITETDHPEQAVAALERALEFDPVNEELYQRIMRIHGRAGRPDAVRRTLRRLEQCLTELGDAEPSEATRRVAARQLQPTTAGDRR